MTFRKFSRFTKFERFNLDGNYIKATMRVRLVRNCFFMLLHCGAYPRVSFLATVKFKERPADQDESRWSLVAIKPALPLWSWESHTYSAQTHSRLKARAIAYRYYMTKLAEHALSMRRLRTANYS